MQKGLTTTTTQLFCQVLACAQTFQAFVTFLRTAQQQNNQPCWAVLSFLKHHHTAKKTFLLFVWKQHCSTLLVALHKESTISVWATVSPSAFSTIFGMRPNSLDQSYRAISLLTWPFSRRKKMFLPYLHLLSCVYVGRCLEHTTVQN